MIYFYIIIAIIIIISILLIISSNFYNKIKTQVLKINSSESEVDEALREKYDLINKICAELKSIDKENENYEKTNELVNNIKNENISSFEFYRFLSDIESQIYSFKSENSKIEKNKSFSDLWYEICNINTKIKAIIKYYNENISIYNDLVSKFPSKIIATILKYNEKKYFDGKNMYDKNIKDFKF